MFDGVFYLCSRHSVWFHFSSETRLETFSSCFSRDCIMQSQETVGCSKMFWNVPIYHFLFQHLWCALVTASPNASEENPHHTCSWEWWTASAMAAGCPCSYQWSSGKNESIGFDWLCSLQMWTPQWWILASQSTTKQNTLRFLFHHASTIISPSSASDTCINPSLQKSTKPRQHLTLQRLLLLFTFYVLCRLCHCQVLIWWQDYLKWSFYVFNTHIYLIHILSCQSAKHLGVSKQKRKNKNDTGPCFTFKISNSSGVKKVSELLRWKTHKSEELAQCSSLGSNGNQFLLTGAVCM